MGESSQMIKSINSQGKYLTFRLGNEEYGLGIMMIKEIIGMMTITAIPQTPSYVKGVINLRGKVIPVVDLRLRFSMEEIPHDDRTCIIVTDIGGGAADVLVGLIVDSVSEVMNIDSDKIEPPPSFGITLDTDYILGIAKSDSDVRILLDIGRVFSDNELDSFR